MIATSQNELAIESVCRKLQLDDTREKILSTAFSSVTQWLEDDPDFWGREDQDILLYAYGSRDIGTVVKPKSHEEYDVDFVIQTDYDHLLFTPEDFRLKLFNRLREHATYRDKISLIRFGVRINYEGQLHMDVMPACFLPGSSRLVAPDCKKGSWVPRNLKGYSSWFKAKFVHDLRMLPLYEHYRSRGFIIEARAETEALPAAVPFVAVQPLQKAVQLIKRHRNIHFENDTDSATSSIILTTLAGEYYDSSFSTIQAVDKILKLLLHERIQCKVSGRKLRVYNPADSAVHLRDKELLSSKWEEPDGQKLYAAFWSFVESMNTEWTKLQLARTKAEKGIILKGLFGETIGNEVLEDRSVWGLDQGSGVVYDMPHVKRTAAKTSPWQK